MKWKKTLLLVLILVAGCANTKQHHKHQKVQMKLRHESNQTKINRVIIKNLRN